MNPTHYESCSPTAHNNFTCKLKFCAHTYLSSTRVAPESLQNPCFSFTHTCIDTSTSKMHTEPANSFEHEKMPISTGAVLAPISLGELIDKITILEIKNKHLQGPALENARFELNALQQTLSNLQINIDTALIHKLKDVNQRLWQIEDEIRDQERQNDFGEIFIHLARSVYRENDQRAAIKKEINSTYGSALVEEKSYQQY